MCPQQGTSRPPGTPEGKRPDPPPERLLRQPEFRLRPQDPERTSCRFKSPGVW